MIIKSIDNLKSNDYIRELNKEKEYLIFKIKQDIDLFEFTKKVLKKYIETEEIEDIGEYDFIIKKNYYYNIDGIRYKLDSCKTYKEKLIQVILKEI